LPIRTALPRAKTSAALLLTIGATLGATLAGCGSSGSSGEPSSLAPASVPLYASIAIKPSDGSKGAASEAAKKLTHLAEPYGSVAQALLSSEASKLDFKRDIEPWVGASAGVFVTSLDTSKLSQNASSIQSLLEGGLSGAASALGASTFGSNGAQGAIVLETSDVGAAKSFLAKRASGSHAMSYRGVSYQVSSEGAAEGIVKNFAVIGSESGMRSAIDTSLGGATVTSAPGYTKPPSNAIASAYLRPETLLKSVHGAGGVTSQGLSLLGQLLAGSQSASLSVTPTSNSISLQGEIHSANGSSTPLFGQEGAKALGELPAGSWLAAGVGSTGAANLPRAFALLRGVASFGTSTVFSTLGGPSIEKLFAALDSPKAHLEQDFGSWAGPGSMFVSGTGLFNLQAGLVIASNDPTASRAAVGKLGNLMREAGAVVSNTTIAGTDAALTVKLTGFPAVIYIANGQGKFVLGLGQQSVEGALAPSSTLATSPAYSTATATLGGGIEPSLIVEFPTLIGFLEGVGLTQSPSLANILPYLKSLGTLTAGATSQDGVEHFRVVLGLA
jgi:hypothetical protein